MMEHEALFNLLGGIATGTTLGMWIGYRLRRSVERDARVHRLAEHDEILGGPNRVRPAKRHTFTPAATSFIPIVGVRGQKAAPEPTSTNQDRDDVVAALVGAGYKKSTANAAADACTVGERASGVQAWTIAALRQAMRGDK
jgi:hypothetical protein